MVKLDRDGGRYERCNLDGTKCDTYPADFVASGVFTSAIPRGRATFSRYTSDGEITEVVTLGHDVMVNRGRCVAR